MATQAETILYGVRKGNEDWQEEIIAVNGSPSAKTYIEGARMWAEDNGFDRFRIAKHHVGERPDFTRTLNT